jgi:hypothetical protein
VRWRDDRRIEHDWLGVWINEMHADYLAHDRLAEARALAARQAIVAEVRRLQWLAVRVRLGRLIAAASAVVAGWWATAGRLTSRPSRRWLHR